MSKPKELFTEHQTKPTVSGKPAENGKPPEQLVKELTKGKK